MNLSYLDEINLNGRKIVWFSLGDWSLKMCLHILALGKLKNDAQISLQQEKKKEKKNLFTLLWKSKWRDINALVENFEGRGGFWKGKTKKMSKWKK